MLQTIPCFQRFAWLNHRHVRDILRIALKPPKIGRKGYDKTLMFRWLVYKQVMKCSYRDLESMTGIDHSTFVKFKKRLMRRFWFPGMFAALSRAVAGQLPAIIALLDSSFVQTYSKHDEPGSEYNGYKEKNGFKVHQMIDFETRLPLAQIATPGARSDIKLGEALIRGSPPNWNVSALVADKGYDGANFVKAAKKHWTDAKVVIPLRRMKPAESDAWRKIKAAERTRNRKFLKKRTEIERYFSRKKRVFGLGEERTRGIKNFEANCYLTSIAEILEWMTKPACLS